MLTLEQTGRRQGVAEERRGCHQGEEEGPEGASLPLILVVASSMFGRLVFCCLNKRVRLQSKEITKQELTALNKTVEDEVAR